MRKFPVFKYHPEPINNEVFVKSNCECPCCGEITGYSYVGPFYSFLEVDGICPWCIDSGKAAEKYEATFVDEDEIDEILSDDSLDLLTKRTPGFLFPQYDSWPSHCGDYCQIIGYVNERNLEKCISNYTDDLRRIGDKLELDEDDLLKEFKRSDSPLRFYLFRCKKCSHEKIDADYE